MRPRRHEPERHDRAERSYCLSKTNSTQNSLTASWTASTDNVGVAGYTVYVNGAASSAAAVTSHTISGLACGTTYTIGVDAYDAAGNHSAQTSTTMPTSACPGDTTPPSTPTNLHQSGSTATSVTVSWTASTDNVGVTGYGAYKNGTLAGSPTTTSYTFTASPAAPATASPSTPPTQPATARPKPATTVSTNACPDTTPPSTPTGLATSAVGQTSITLSWTASSDNVGVTGYGVYQSGTPGRDTDHDQLHLQRPHLRHQLHARRRRRRRSRQPLDPNQHHTQHQRLPRHHPAVNTHGAHHERGRARPRSRSPGRPRATTSG